MTLILDHIEEAHKLGRKQLAVLIDPDKPDQEGLIKLVNEAVLGGADLIFLGGSLLVKDRLDECLEIIKEQTTLPVILFPGSALQISDKADAMLFLSLISGRNPELLIGTHVISAPFIRQAGLETLPTGYMLVDCGKATTASYMSGSLPIPYDKPEIAACTAMAGEMLGLRIMYLDGGSGAAIPISADTILQVRQSVKTPIIVGGGIRTAEQAANACKAGADIVVVGNATEENPDIIRDIAASIHSFSGHEHLH